MRYFGVFSQVDCMVPIHNTVIREKVVSEASTLKVYFYCVFFLRMISLLLLFDRVVLVQSPVKKSVLKV
jgi:hypothetical protein